MTKHILYKFRAIELSILAYILLTSLLIFIKNQDLTNLWEHLAFRLFVLIVIVLFISIKKEHYKNRWIIFFRTFWPFIIVGFFYTETDYLNNFIFKENLDPFFFNLELKIFGMNLSEVFSQNFHSNTFAEIMYFGYFSYYLLIVGLPLLIYFISGFEVTEKIIFIIINSFLIYYLIFIIFPVAGPQFYFENSAQNLPQGYIFGWLIRIIQYYGEAPTAAFPSSHVSICLMLVWLCFKNIKKILIVVIPIAILLILSTIYIKAHYVIDILAAFITTPIIYIASSKLYGFLNLMYNQNDNINIRG